MKLTSTDAERINEIRDNAETFSAYYFIGGLRAESEGQAGNDLWFLLNLIDQLIPDCFELTPEARDLLGATHD